MPPIANPHLAAKPFQLLGRSAGGFELANLRAATERSALGADDRSATLDAGGIIFVRETKERLRNQKLKCMMLYKPSLE